MDSNLRMRNLALGLLILSLLGFSVGCSQTGISTNSDLLEQNLVTHSEATDGEIVEISRDELEALIADEDYNLVYVGRPSCPDCQEFYPSFEQWVHESGKTVFYYNTQTKASGKQEMREYIVGLGIEEIPSILVLERGEVSSVICGIDEAGKEAIKALL